LSEPSPGYRGVMLIISHRGTCQRAPENSIEAFEKAIQIACDRIELDLQLALDGTIWIHHDDELFALTGKDQRISRMTSQELTQVRLSNGETLPSLDQVLEQILPRIELNLEIKGSGERLASLAAQKVMATGHHDKVIFSSFSKEPLSLLQRDYPGLNRALLLEKTTPLPLTMGELGCRIIHPDIDMVDQNFMDQANRHGWTVIPWASMKSQEDYRRYLLWEELHHLGIHGLCTNYPEELLSFKRKGFTRG
jgi:glycerophosphoryl diester phosphodiesterase